MATSQVRHHDDDETEVLQFNLTNPEQLTEQLQHADLDDEETDVLLKEAMRINAKLKEALRIQQIEEKDPKQRTGNGRMRMSEPPAPRNPKQSSLPPIVSKSDKSMVGAKQGHKDMKLKGLSNGQRPQVPSADKRKGSASNKSRPAWDDRFSFD